VTRAGLTLTQQAPANAVTLSLDADTTPTAVTQTVTRPTAVQDALIATIHAAADGHNPLTFRDHLTDNGIDALAGTLADAAVNAVRTYPHDELKQGAILRFLRAVRSLGTGRSKLTDAHQLGRLLALNHENSPTPTLAVHIHTEFLNDVRRSQRDRVLGFLTALADGMDVRLVASTLVQHRLAVEHRETLPVSRQDVTPLADTTTSADIDAALAELDPDGRPVDVLRQLAETAGETETYHALTASAQVSRSRIRQCISTLADHALVATFETGDGRTVELRKAGQRVLDALDAEYGRQQELNEIKTGGVSETGNSVSDSRVTPRAHEGRPRGQRLASHHETSYLPRWQHAAATATAPSGGLGLADYPVDPATDRGERGWSYDPDRDRLVVSAEYDNPLQYWTCVALALADRRTWDEVLTEDRLTGIDLGGVLMRQARCIGGVSSEAEDDPSVLRENIADWAADLRELTRQLANDEYEDRDRFRGEITRSAHGLAGSLVHLLDLAGVDIVREVRVPRYREFDAGDRRDLARTLAVGAAIQSRHGHFAAYRQLFEGREEKRDQAITPTVDASDPVGELIGGFSVVGPGVSELASDLEDTLASPRDVAEDAPEFQVPVTVDADPSRRQFAEASQHVLAAKDLSPTQDAVSVLAALTASAYDAARALHELAPETKSQGRRVEASDLTYALGTLAAGRILPGAAPTVSKAVHALLVADGALSQSALAEAADVSSRSLRTHWETLAALPWTATEQDALRVSVLPGTSDAVAAAYEVACELAGDTIVDVSSGVGAAFVWPPDIEVIRSTWWWGRPVLAYAGGIDDPPREVAFGPRVGQAALDDAGTRDTRGGLG
jgi:hypothetical protein